MRRLISSGNPLEAEVGYSRAIVQAGWCFVAGTTGRDPDTGAMPEDIGEQTHNAFATVEAALSQGGFSLRDVVRAVYYLVDPSDQTIVNPIIGEFFGTIRPAATMVVVRALAAPEMKIEIELTAFRD